MHLNSLSPAPGHKTPKLRVGRGIGSGLGKTCGRGHKGQKARKSGNVRPGFEGGQMPLQKRLPKYGFVSRISLTTAQVRSAELSKVDGDLVTLETLKAANVLNESIKRAKIFLSGEITKSFVIKGLTVTKGARQAIEAAGGKVEE
ncbi:MAG: 50S ribosomal protein L15 [Cellvibrionales bacterium]|jgi:large subunit ribosomal protein L15|nr:50S ribosomal protein L15 [Cellvibrionales bacterium]MBK8675184.1 50S ribosomal protein L15 [Cellvibrionales bacterium]